MDDKAIVVVPMALMDDLLAMAQLSKPYRDGEAWTAVAMSQINRIVYGAVRRSSQDGQ